MVFRILIFAYTLLCAFGADATPTTNEAEARAAFAQTLALVARELPQGGTLPQEAGELATLLITKGAATCAHRATVGQAAVSLGKLFLSQTATGPTAAKRGIVAHLFTAYRRWIEACSKEEPNLV